jgi:hypothetical protein
MQCNLSGGGFVSHHQRIYLSAGELDIGYVRITNDGTILSIWIQTDRQRMLFKPEHPELIEMLIGEEE